MICPASQSAARFLQGCEGRRLKILGKVMGGKGKEGGPQSLGGRLPVVGISAFKRKTGIVICPLGPVW